MGFNDALIKLRSGYKVRREGWQVGLWLLQFTEHGGEVLRFLNGNGLLVSFSLADVLADDWSFAHIDNMPGLSFAQAMAHAVLGHQVSRPGSNTKLFFVVSTITGKRALTSAHGSTGVNLSEEDVLATDWASSMDPSARTIKERYIDPAIMAQFGARRKFYRVVQVNKEARFNLGEFSTLARATEWMLLSSDKPLMIVEEVP